jgi:uncharacterized membrane protein
LPPGVLITRLKPEALTEATEDGVAACAKATVVRRTQVSEVSMTNGFIRICVM